MRFSEFYAFVKKKTRQIAQWKIRQIKMDGDTIKSLKTAILVFYKFHTTTSKGKEYTYKNSKNLVYIRLQSTDGWILKKTGNLDRKSGSEGGNQKVTIATEKKWV